MKAAICCFTLALVIGACESVNISGNKVKIGSPKLVLAYVYKEKATEKIFYCKNKLKNMPEKLVYKGVINAQLSEILPCNFKR